MIPLNSVVQIKVKPLQLSAWTENCDFTFESHFDIEALYQNSVFSRSIRNRIKKLFNVFQSSRIKGLTFLVMTLFNSIFVQGVVFIPEPIFHLDAIERTKMLQCGLGPCFYI